MKSKIRDMLKASRLAMFVKLNFYDAIRSGEYKYFRREVKRLIAVTAKNHGRGWLVLTVDMIVKCYVTQAWYFDYFRFEFYKKPLQEANAFLTKGRHALVYPLLSTEKNRSIMDRKYVFNQVFKDYIKRDWVHIGPDSSAAEIEAFVGKHPVFIGKRESLNMGRGIQLVDSTKFPTSDALLAHLKAFQLFLLEERVRNHKELEILSKVSLNTLRIITVRHPECVKIIGALLKFGDGDNVADSPGAGYKCPVDAETGIVYNGVTGSGELQGRFLPRHPAGYEMIGMKIPYWDSLVAMVKEAALLLDGAFYVPWDVAVSPDGPLLIEGNCNCGYYYQWATGKPVYADMKKAWEYAKAGRKNKLF